MEIPIHATYLDQAVALLGRIRDEEGEAICRAGVAVADRVADDRLIYVVGPMIVPIMLFHQMQLMVCAVLARRYATRQS